MIAQPVYLETWDENESAEWSWSGAHRKLAAAAPDVVRALLLVELKGDLDDYGPGCSVCGFHVDAWHKVGCRVDAALTKAGFPDQASRDEARAQIAAEKGTSQ